MVRGYPIFVDSSASTTFVARTGNRRAAEAWGVRCVQGIIMASKKPRKGLKVLESLRHLDFGASTVIEYGFCWPMSAPNLGILSR
jgi:hypothetical protein